MPSWTGSLEELKEAAGRLITEHPHWDGRRLEVPTRSRVIDYRTHGLISPANGKRYEWRHLVQLVVGCAFVQSGVPRKALALKLQTMSVVEMLDLLQGGMAAWAAAGVGRPAVKAESQEDRDRTIWARERLHETVRLLAAGLVDGFRQARAGKAPVHDPELSKWFRGALSRLAALYLSFGLPVQHDGVHGLIAQCRRPLRALDWGLPALDWPEFQFHGLRLLDPLSRVPTLDCVELARHVSSDLDIREQMAFAQLKSTCDQFASRGNDVYAAVREFVVRHPVTQPAEIKKFLEERNMQLASAFLSSCYEPVLAHHIVQGSLMCCTNCRMPMAASTLEGHAACVARQCKAYDVPVMIQRRTWSPDTVVAKPHILMYWCAPGIDEIALYDAARSHKLSDVVLYPGRDVVDLAVEGTAIGIDVKSHASPLLLAQALSSGTSGLDLFTKKIIAVNDQSIARFDGYLDVLRRECERSDIEFMSVSVLRRQLRPAA